MCILFIAVDRHPEYPLIICANRDEFYNRPTRSARFWQKAPSLLAGKDLQAGGSWLGVNHQGNFAAVTNLRTGKGSRSDASSRGELIVNSLQPASEVNDEWLISHCDNYNPFNLVYGTVNSLRCFHSISRKSTPLTPGFHAISNGAMDDIWPKMSQGKRALEKLIVTEPSFSHEQLFSILKDETKADMHLLPDTGISKEWEALLSSIFIVSDKYGTRSSTIITVDNQGSVNFNEREYDTKGQEIKTQQFTFSI